MTFYCISWLWGVCILLSFIGWGNFLKHSLELDKKIDWAQKAAWGVALSIFIGGILNLFNVISPLLIKIYVVTGMVCFISLDFSEIRAFLMSLPTKVINLWKKDKITFFGISLVILIALFLYSGWVFTYLVHSDDLEAYAVYPQKMLQQGALGAEPFSDRRTSALGGQSFLHTLILSVLTNRNLRIMDPALALIIALGLLWGFAKKTRTPSKLTLIPIFFLLLTPPLSTNVSSLVMGSTLFLALFQVLEEQSYRQHVRICLISLLAAAICASKSNLIVFCGSLLTIFYVLRLQLQTNKKDSVSEFLQIILWTTLFLLPWMIASYQASGTLLYPLLGRGFHRSAYGFPEFLPITWLSVGKTLWILAQNPLMIFLILLCLINLKCSDQKKSQFSTVVYLSVLTGVFIVNLLTFNSYPRYTSAFLFTSLATLVLYSLSDDIIHEKFRKTIRWIVFLLIIFFLHNYIIKSNLLLRQSKAMINFSNLSKSSDTMVSPFEINSYFKAQQSVPYGQAILARGLNPYLLNFQRNTIYLVDFVIMGPPPGLPIFQGGEAVADYLLSKGIRYVLFNYGKCTLSRQKDILASYRMDHWVSQQFLFTFAFEQDLRELGLKRKKLYKDKYIFVIDLAKKIKVK